MTPSKRFRPTAFSELLPFAATEPPAPCPDAPPPVASTVVSAPAVSEAPSALARPIAITEVEGFGPRLLGELPLPSTLHGRTAGGDVVITTSTAEYERHRAAGVPVFSGRELAAMALAAEHDRGSPAALAQWCDRKRTEPAWALGAVEAIGGAVGVFEPRGWPIGRVFLRYGIELTAVEVCDG